MNSPQDTAEYIQLLLDEAQIPYPVLVPQVLDEDDEFFQPPLFYDGHLVAWSINLVAHGLGTTKEDLIQGTRKHNWGDKFPYFQLAQEANFADDCAAHGRGYGAQRILDAIFCEEDKVPKTNYTPFFDRKQVAKRLKATVTEYSKIYPDIYQEGCDLVNIKVGTENLYHFKKMPEMVKEFFELVTRAEELFFRCLESELTQEEIFEYNFLVSALGIHDLYMGNTDWMYHSLVIRRKELYKKENMPNFNDYVGFNSVSMVNRFFRCPEFLDDKESVQKIASYIPLLKSQIRQIAMLMKKYHCIYQYKGENTQISPIQEIYLDKTKAELGTEQKYIDILEKLSSPRAQGGLNTKYENSFSEKLQDNLPKISARIGHGGRWNSEWV